MWYDLDPYLDLIGDLLEYEASRRDLPVTREFVTKNYNWAVYRLQSNGMQCPEWDIVNHDAVINRIVLDLRTR